MRGGAAARDGHSLLLLDGQQRLTTPYVLFKGKAPRFYEGESLFFDLHFNRQTQEFRFWQKSQMENNPAWIGVHEFLQEGLAALLERLEQLDEERRTIPLMRSFWLCKKVKRKRALRYLVQRPAGETPHVVFEVFEPRADGEVPNGTVTRARATCLCCAAVLPPERVRAQLAAERGGAD